MIEKNELSTPTGETIFWLLVRLALSRVLGQDLNLSESYRSELSQLSRQSQLFAVNDHPLIVAADLSGIRINEAHERAFEQIESIVNNERLLDPSRLETGVREVIEFGQLKNIMADWGYELVNTNSADRFVSWAPRDAIDNSGFHEWDRPSIITMSTPMLKGTQLVYDRGFAISVLSRLIEGRIDDAPSTNRVLTVLSISNQIRHAA